jgi:hypothetical protein
MKQNYSVRLVARNEGIEYRDEHDIYRFNTMLKNKKWTVFVPGSKGKYFEPHELTDEEQSTILPRIKKYLEGKKYFGFIGPSYPVIFEREGQVSIAIEASRLGARRYWDRKKFEQR